MAQVKERGGGGEERKETLADKPWDFENHPFSRKKSLTFQKRSKKMLLHWRANLADQNKQQPLKINIRVTYQYRPRSMKQTFDRHMSTLFEKPSQSDAAFAGERSFSKSRGLWSFICKRFLPFFPTPSPLFYLRHFSRGL